MNECYLTRQQLIVRVEEILGKDCFGVSAWEDVFYRDLRMVKKAMVMSGMRLAFSRKKKHPGYYLVGLRDVSTELADIIRNSMAEADPIQLDIFQRMTPAQRFFLGCSVTDAARNAVSYRAQQRDPDMNGLQIDLPTHLPERLH